MTIPIKPLRIWVARVLTVMGIIVMGIPALACAATRLTPDDFAFGMPLQLQGEAAIYTLTVPKEVYQHALRTDLGDMRVFNSDGEWVTYAVSTPVARQSRAPLVTVPIFPLHGDPSRALDRIKVTIAAEQGSVHLQTSRNTAPAHIQAYVIDTRKLGQPLTALELHWPADAAEYSGHVEVESSNDLGHWSLVASNLPLVNLHFGDQQLLQNRLQFSALKANYLRLRWQDRPAPFAITAMLAETAPTHTEPPRVQAEIAGHRVAEQADTYEFALDFHAPVDRVNLLLPQSNTLADLTLLSRSQRSFPWREIAALRVYDLQNNGTEIGRASCRERVYVLV